MAPQKQNDRVTRSQIKNNQNTQQMRRSQSSLKLKSQDKMECEQQKSLKKSKINEMEIENLNSGTPNKRRTRSNQIQLVKQQKQKKVVDENEDVKIVMLTEEQKKEFELLENQVNNYSSCKKEEKKKSSINNSKPLITKGNINKKHSNEQKSDQDNKQLDSLKHQNDENDEKKENAINSVDQDSRKKRGRKPKNDKLDINSQNLQSQNTEKLSKRKYEKKSEKLNNNLQSKNQTILSMIDIKSTDYNEDDNSLNEENYKNIKIIEEKEVEINANNTPQNQDIEEEQKIVQKRKRKSRKNENNSSTPSQENLLKVMQSKDISKDMDFMSKLFKNPIEKRNSSEQVEKQEYEQNKENKSQTDIELSQESTQQQSSNNLSLKNQQPGEFQQNTAKTNPPIEDQNLNIENNKYVETIRKLQEYALPEEIPCRESEKQEISDFISEGLRNNGSSNCLYISGVPGIGKTASFLEVIKKLQEENEKKNEQFTFIHINAMNLSNPENLYVVLLKQITGIVGSSKTKACQILNELLTTGKLPKRFEEHNEKLDKKNKVILLDELDFLVTKDQELLYNLMEWPHHKHSKLTIIGIANTMNLPENLMNKIKSRMGSRRLIFNQYNSKQIQEIIKTRLQKVEEVFEQIAIDYTCTKIAISSSDIRKTLKVLRKAVQICQKESLSSNQEDMLVSIQMINQAYSSLYSSPIIQAVSKLSLHHKVIILSITLENKHRGNTVSYLSESYQRYKIMLSNLGISQTLNYNQIKQVLNQLSSLNVLQLKEKLITKDSQHVGLDPNKKQYTNVADIQIISNFTVDEITNSLRMDEVYLKFQFQF